jgi:hypothetical protein
MVGVDNVVADFELDVLERCDDFEILQVLFG